jgi:hypothetical protein
MSKENKMINVRAGWGRWLGVTLVLGVAAFLTSPNGPLGGFWHSHAGSHNPAETASGVQMLLFVLLTVIQSLAFGLGAAFLIFGWSYVKSVAARGLALPLYLAVAWSLISWWPHTNLHQVFGAENLNSLLAIEYGFHVTLILGGMVVAYFLLTQMRQDPI